MFRIYRTDGSFEDYEQPESVTDRGAVAGIVFADPVKAPNPRTRGRICLVQAEWYIWPLNWDYWYPLRSEHDLIIDWIMRRGVQSLRNAIKGETMMDRAFNDLWREMKTVEIDWLPPKSAFDHKQELAKR